MSTVIQMPTNEDEIVKLVQQRIRELEVVIETAERELKTKREFLAKTTLPFAGMRLQDCVVQVLKEHRRPLDEDSIVAECVKRGAAYGTRSPEGDVRRSLAKMAKAGTIKRTKDGKVELLDE